MILAKLYFVCGMIPFATVVVDGTFSHFSQQLIKAVHNNQDCRHLFDTYPVSKSVSRLLLWLGEHDYELLDYYVFSDVDPELFVNNPKTCETDDLVVPSGDNLSGAQAVRQAFTWLLALNFDLFGSSAGSRTSSFDPAPSCAPNDIAQSIRRRLWDDQRRNRLKQTVDANRCIVGTNLAKVNFFFQMFRFAIDNTHVPSDLVSKRCERIIGLMHRIFAYFFPDLHRCVLRGGDLQADGALILSILAHIRDVGIDVKFQLAITHLRDDTAQQYRPIGNAMDFGVPKNQLRCRDVNNKAALGTPVFRKLATGFQSYCDKRNFNFVGQSPAQTDAFQALLRKIDGNPLDDMDEISRLTLDCVVTLRTMAQLAAIPPVKVEEGTQTVIELGPCRMANFFVFCSIIQDLWDNKKSRDLLLDILKEVTPSVGNVCMQLHRGLVKVGPIGTGDADQTFSMASGGQAGDYGVPHPIVTQGGVGAETGIEGGQSAGVDSMVARSGERDGGLYAVSGGRVVEGGGQGRSVVAGDRRDQDRPAENSRPESIYDAPPPEELQRLHAASMRKPRPLAVGAAFERNRLTASARPRTNGRPVPPPRIASLRLGRGEARPLIGRSENAGGTQAEPTPPVKPPRGIAAPSFDAKSTARTDASPAVTPSETPAQMGAWRRRKVAPKLIVPANRAVASGYGITETSPSVTPSDTSANFGPPSRWNVAAKSGVPAGGNDASSYAMTETSPSVTPPDTPVFAGPPKRPNVAAKPRGMVESSAGTPDRATQSYASVGPSRRRIVPPKLISPATSGIPASTPVGPNRRLDESSTPPKPVTRAESARRRLWNRKPDVSA